MEPVTLGMSAVLLTGLAYGAGPCNVACLPYLGPVFLHEGAAWKRVLPFSLGRLAGYALMGAAAGAAGYTATQMLEGRAAAIVLGGATLAAGLSLLWRGRRRCVAPVRTEATVQFARRPLPWALFVMGIGMAFNPCLPLGAVLLAAAATGDVGAGASLGAAFGLGAVVLPAVVFSTVVAHFGAQVRAQLAPWRNRLEVGSGVALAALGTVTALGWIRP